MYRYTDTDHRIVAERVSQFQGQTRRHLAGELSVDQFRPLRLQNGLYIEKHNPMLRIAIPYGQLSSRQLRQLARITDHYRACRRPKESFIDTVRRIGTKSFAAAAYAQEILHIENEREVANG
ncbi:hypothetical protein MASR1M60_13610 [Rhodocyclaceae bacterium]